MKLSEKRISSECVYDGRILKLEVDEVELPDGKRAVRECVRHNGGAAVLLVKDGKVLLVRQFRYPYNEAIYEIPAGKLNEGEDAEAAAVRELVEETGYRAKLKRAFDLYPSPGYTDEIIHVYFAESYEYVGQRLDEDEFLNCEFVSISEVLKMIEDGIICDAKTISAIFKYLSGK